jgi:hypothetical protein
MKKMSAKGMRWTDGIIGTNENSVAEEMNEVQSTRQWSHPTTKSGRRKMALSGYCKWV